MLRGYRGLCIAAGLGALIWAALFGFSLGSLNTNKERYQSYRYAADKPPEIDAARTGVARAQPLEYRRPCHDPKGETESDLCAQWKAANAAEDSAFWAQWGFWIAVIGSSFLLWQIMLTREAVEDTGEATKAMQRANDAEFRPWIAVDLKADQGIQPEPGKPGAMNIFCSVKLTNLGRGAAVEVLASIGTYNVHRTAGPKRPITPQGWNGMTLLPGEAMPQNAFANISAIDAADLPALVIIATAWYTDPITGGAHHTSKGFMFDGEIGVDERGNHIPRFKKIIIGNSAT